MARQSIIDLSAKSVDETLRNAENSINSFFNKMNTITFAIYKERVSYGFMTPTALDYLSSESVYQPNPVLKGLVISSFLERLVHYDDSIRTIFFVEKKTEDVYSASNQRFHNSINSSYNFFSEPWFEDVVNNPSRRTQLLVGRSVEYGYYYRSAPKGLYSIARNIYQVDNRLNASYLGTLVINLDGQGFSNLFEGLDPRSHTFFIIDPGDNVIYSTPSEIILEESLSLIRSSKDDTITIGSNSYSFSYKTFGAHGVTLVGLTDIKALTKEFDRIRDFTLSTVLSFLLLSFFCLRLLNRSVAYPVKTIKENMLMVERGEFDSLQRIAGNNEFSEINNNLISAAKKTSEYIDTAFVAQLNKKNADLYALQSQIKPHFIMNVLETIRMNLVGRDDAQNARAVMLLGKFTREHLAANDRMVTLKDELELANSYMEIISYCFKNTIDLQLDIPPELMERKVLKMLLQPILENSVKHGFLANGMGGYIKISAYLTISGIRLIVMDNGCGILPERLMEVKCHLASGEVSLDCANVGLKNVQDRLYSYYGAEARLTISSVYSEGTMVYLDIPTRE